MFQLDERLAADTIELGDLTLCRVLLMNDSNYPWVILVPRREGVREIYELSEADQQQLLAESSQLASVMAGLFKADKMNVAALGNMVPQLHIHHIARSVNDAAWPKPVWGAVAGKPYSTDAMQQRSSALKKALFG